MPSKKQEPLGNGFLNAVVLYLFVFAYPVVVALEIANYDVPWTAQLCSMFLTVCSLGCLLGRGLVPEFNAFWKVAGPPKDKDKG